MKIIIKENYKSIKKSAVFELPKFTIITGLNGSGKTHFLEAITYKNITETYIEGILANRIKFIKFGSLIPSIQESCNPNDIDVYIKNVFNSLKKAKTALSQLYNDNSYLPTNNDCLKYVSDIMQKKFLQKTFINKSKNFNEIEESDLRENFDISFLGTEDLFFIKIALIYKDYHIKWFTNEMNDFLKSKGKPTYKEVLKEEDFKKKYGRPPWEIIDRFLEENNLPYKSNNPLNTEVGDPFKFKLKSTINDNIEIQSAYLSTGEKVLLTLALAIYNIGRKTLKPDLLLIDEPDAGLHPSMAKKMIDILEKNIVSESNIPTIITTHSPTTLIAAEGISIYKKEKESSIPLKVSSQEAVEILTGDIPFLKISTEARRQVIVESKYDVEYYELLTNILNKKEKLSSLPNFFQARPIDGDGSNCQAVMDICNFFIENGNDQVYGIIDWDLQNESDNEKILVLGEGERYAIENYILDPLLVGFFLLIRNKRKIIDFDLLSIKSIADLKYISKEDSQKIINKILEELGLFSENIVTYKLYNEWELNVTKEFNEIQGHELENLYKEKYSNLREFNRENAFKKEIIESIIDAFPDFTPYNLFDVLRKIK